MVYSAADGRRRTGGVEFADYRFVQANQLQFTCEADGNLHLVTANQAFDGLPVDEGTVVSGLVLPDGSGSPVTLDN